MGVNHEPYDQDKCCKPANHPATEGVEEYASEGRAYYKKAAVAQIAIGVGAVFQAVGTWAIAIILALAFLTGCSTYGTLVKDTIEASDQPVKSLDANFKSKKLHIEFDVNSTK